MTSAVPFPARRNPDHVPGDAVPAPPGLLTGPGRSWDTEPRWRWVRIRVGGRWRPGRVERWHLHLGSTQWVAMIHWGAGTFDRAWYLHTPQTVVRAPKPAGGHAPWEVPPAGMNTEPR